MSDNNLLDRLVEAAGDTDVVVLVKGNKSNTEQKKLTMTVSIQDNGNLAFDITSDITPELLAYMFVRIAVISDGEQLIKILENNGYTDVRYRIQKSSNDSISALMNEMTLPEEPVKQKTEDKTEDKTVDKNDIKSKVEAAILQAIQQAESEGIEIKEVKVMNLEQKPEDKKPSNDEDRPFINALH